MENIGVDPPTHPHANNPTQEELGQVVKPRELLKAIRYEISGVQKIIKESQDALKVRTVARCLHTN